MQFELISSSFDVLLKISEWGTTEKTKESIYLSFKRLGGIEGMRVNAIKQWRFPLFITSQVISEIIRNTCFICGGLMKDDTLMLNVLPSLIEPVKQIKVRKCSQCGHSHT